MQPQQFCDKPAVLYSAVNVINHCLSIINASTGKHV